VFNVCIDLERGDRCRWHHRSRRIGHGSADAAAKGLREPGDGTEQEANEETEIEGESRLRTHLRGLLK
jgi:hypothetical protein